MNDCRVVALRAGLIACLVLCCGYATATPVVVGSKQFIESTLLGELTATILRDAGVAVRHQGNLGGTQLVWQALRRGDIDVYSEYTGTLAEEVFGGRLGRPVSTDALLGALREQGIAMTAPLGFNNGYALGMLKRQARQLNVHRISDLAAHPHLKFGFSNEFLDRGDGWRSLREHYGLPHTLVTGLEHELAYRGVASGDIDVVDLYATDPEIAYYGLEVLADDRGHFPEYLAVILYRAELADRQPRAVDALRRLEGQIAQEDMIAMNRRVKLEQQRDATVAAAFLNARLGIVTNIDEESWATAVWRRTKEHLRLVGISLCAAVLVGIPLGIASARWRRLGHGVIASIGVLQTIPALALLVFMIPISGIGDRSAILAIFIYSILPIVRNTCSGLQSIPRSLLESADAIGLPRIARLRLVELPLASRAVFAGVKTAAVINVGTATLGALVGAGGYGQPILTGIRLDDMPLILQGAVPAAVLALAIQLAFDVLEARLLPRSLK